MNLYLLEQDQVSGYDTFDKAVVAAETSEIAKTIHPGGRKRLPCETYGDWPSDVKHVTATLIGMAANDIAEGVVCASFSAG